MKRENDVGGGSDGGSGSDGGGINRKCLSIFYSTMTHQTCLEKRWRRKKKGEKDEDEKNEEEEED